MSKRKKVGLVIGSLLLLFLVGYLPIHFYSKKQVEGLQTQVTQPKIETPKVEAPKSTETTPEPVVTPTNKSSNTQSKTTQPATTSQSTPTPDPVKTCNEGMKYNAIDIENIAYNQYVQNENTRHNAVVADIAKCWQPGVQGCTNLWADDQLHADNLAKLKADHEAKLAEINGRCY
jgi:hypothetical protein